MKPRNTVLFILCVLAGLITLSITLPHEGIDLWGMHLRFPSIHDVVADTEEEDFSEEVRQLTPEEIMENRLAALNAEKMDEFMDYCQTNPARLYLPQDSVNYLDAFFDKMEDAPNHHLRIMHYGDSQLECDRITSFLRQEFQDEFGGMGVGLIPALQSVPTYTISQSISPEWAVSQTMPYGPSDMRGSHKDYGIMTKCTHVNDSTTIQIRGVGGKDYSHSVSFSKVTIITRSEAMLYLYANNSSQPLTLQQSGGLCFYTARLQGSASRATISCSGEADILGIQLDGNKGVNIDNIPMRGCSGNEILTINRGTLAPFFQRENVGLIILQFGGNTVPSMSRNRLSGYKQQVQRLIHLCQELEPEAKILFIGPADMATSIDGRMQSYPIMQELVDTLRTGANEAGAAFWDMYSAMGGKGSIIKWVEARPQLAGGDYVHFTPLGAKKMAHMLYETLQFYYKFYRFRTGKDAITKEDVERQDSLCALQDSLASY